MDDAPQICPDDSDMHGCPKIWLEILYRAAIFRNDIVKRHEVTGSYLFRLYKRYLIGSDVRNWSSVRQICSCQMRYTANVDEGLLRQFAATDHIIHQYCVLPSCRKRIADGEYAACP